MKVFLSLFLCCCYSAVTAQMPTTTGGHDTENKYSAQHVSIEQKIQLKSRVEKLIRDSTGNSVTRYTVHTYAACDWGYLRTEITDYLNSIGYYFFSVIAHTIDDCPNGLIVSYDRVNNSISLQFGIR